MKWSVLVSLALAAVPAAAEEPSCDDPLFREHEARAADRAAIEEKLRLWREFLQIYPHNPCAERARTEIARLEASQGFHREQRSEDRWRQEARGGVIEPDREVFPAWVAATDPAPRNRLRLQTSLAFLTPDLEFHSKAQGPLWSQVLRLDVAPANHLAFSLDLPFLAGRQEGSGFGFAAGNFLLGLHGIWGTWLGDRPLVVAGGLSWSPGSSGWFSDARQRMLDAGAYAAIDDYGFFRYGQTDYAPHIQAEVGLGDHFLLISVVYHFLVQGDPAFKDPDSPLVSSVLRLEMGWQWRLLPWIEPALELHGGVAAAKAGNTNFLYAIPTLRLHRGRLSAGLAVRIPLIDASDLSRMTITLDVGARIF